jgi:glycosyltransferase involved in cell wall biosynthesis
MENKIRLKTSVVLASYNGEKYIQEQLMSIHNQTQNVDEVLIFDDKSTDSTVDICEKFINEKELENWSISVNQNQLGVFQNFVNGTRSANGDIIFFSDQDDIWLNNKVETMAGFFSMNQGLLSLTTTFSRFEGEKILNQHVKHPNRKKNTLKKINLNEFCNFPYYLGMSTAISKELIRKIDFTNEVYKSINKKQLVHDIFFNFISTINDGHYHLDMVLTKRRSYIESVSNVKMSTELVDFNGNIKLYSINEKLNKINLFKTLIDVNYNRENKQNLIKVIEANLRVLTLRYNYLKKLNFFSWLKGIIYLNYYGSPLKYLSDGLEIIKGKVKYNF